MKLVLSIHPLLQLTAILLSFYAIYLGIQRLRSLHLGRPVTFQRDRHVIVGSMALLIMLGGFAGGLVIAARLIEQGQGPVLHRQIGFTLLPLLVIGLFSGFFLYLNPKKRILLPAIHGINNLIIIALSLVQLVTGLQFYLEQVLGK